MASKAGSPKFEAGREGKQRKKHRRELTTYQVLPVHHPAYDVSFCVGNGVRGKLVLGMVKAVVFRV